MKILKHWPLALLGLAIVAGVVTFMPTEKKVRHNVIDSSKGQSAQTQAGQAKSGTDGDKTGTASPASAGQSVAEGNSAGMPLRIINNAPNFNQIVAAASIVNGAVEQRDAAQFVQISTAKHIAELQAQLAKLEAQIAESQLRKAEVEKKLKQGESTQGDISGGEDFVLPDEAPLGDGTDSKALAGSVIPFTANSGEKTEESSDGAKSQDPKVRFARNIKLKGMTGDGRVALQLGSDFALNVEEGQVVWTRYRIERIDQSSSCVTYTDLRVKNSRGKACYN